MVSYLGGLLESKNRCTTAGSQVSKVWRRTERIRSACIRLADAGYGSESDHKFAREELSLRTFIPPKHGRPTEKPAKGRWRRLMQTRFDEECYRKRSQVETVMSMIKRRRRSFCKGKTYWSRCRELHLMVLTHNIMILLRPPLFYRAVASPFSSDLVVP